MNLNSNPKIFLRLAHFNPNFQDKFGNQILDYLVLDALSSAGTLISQSIGDISDYIKNSYLIDFDDIEIIASGKRLAKNKVLEVYCRGSRLFPTQIILGSFIFPRAGSLIFPTS